MQLFASRMVIASIVDAGYFDSMAAFFRVNVVPTDQNYNSQWVEHLTIASFHQYGSTHVGRGCHFVQDVCSFHTRIYPTHRSSQLLRIVDQVGAHRRDPLQNLNCSFWIRKKILLVIALKQAFLTSISLTSISRISVHSFNPSVSDKFAYAFAYRSCTVILLGNASLTPFIRSACAIF